MDERARQPHDGHEEQYARDRARLRIVAPLVQPELPHAFATPIPARHYPLPTFGRMDLPGEWGDEFGGCVY